MTAAGMRAGARQAARCSRVFPRQDAEKLSQSKGQVLQRAQFPSSHLATVGQAHLLPRASDCRHPTPSSSPPASPGAHVEVAVTLRSGPLGDTA